MTTQQMGQEIANEILQKQEVAKEIANTILQQIKATDRMALWAWGSKEFVSLNAEERGERFQLGGLRMKVSGAKHKGLVFIRLMADDTYTVEIGKLRASNYKVLNILEQVYFDELMSTIDHLIERD